MALKHGLGRGLDALLNDRSPPAARPTDAAAPTTAAPPATAPLRVPVASIRVAPWQPRQDFAEDAMQDLIRSVKDHGVLQPLLVRRKGADYELMAGERRLRAAGAAGLADVPVTILDATDEQAVALALIENLQRQDLNALEEAEGYHVLSQKYALTQEEIATRVGKGRATVANALRLLTLPAPVKAMLADGRLSPGHAKVLTGLEIPPEQVQLAERCVREGLSVRQLEQAVARSRQAPRKPRAARSDLPTDHATFLSDRLQQRLGTAVRIQPSRTYANGKKAKGTIEIDFYSNEDLDRIVEVLGLADDEV